MTRNSINMKFIMSLQRKSSNYTEGHKRRLEKITGSYLEVFKAVQLSILPKIIYLFNIRPINLVNSILYFMEEWLYKKN